MKTALKLSSCLLVAVFFIYSCSNSDQGNTVTIKDYQRAEKMLSGYTSQFVYGASVRPVWISDSQFWYTNTTKDGHEYIIADAGNMERRLLFDHTKLANLLEDMTGETYSAAELPLNGLEVNEGLSSMRFSSGGTDFVYKIDDNQLMEDRSPEYSKPNSVKSPDGTKEAFIREHNLWLRDLSNGNETQLTFDGIKDFGYATNNAGWTRRDSPVLLWSPDSKKIATFQHDGRGVGEMYLVTTNVGHPKLDAWKYPLPEDSVIFRIHRVVIDVNKKEVVRLKMKPDQHRSTITDHIATRGGQFADVEWSPDSKMLAFVSTSRDHKHEVFRLADPESGEVTDIYEETEDTFFES